MPEIGFLIDKHQPYARRTAAEEILRGEQLLDWSNDRRPHRASAFTWSAWAERRPSCIVT
jgi:hypothetical protein